MSTRAVTLEGTIQITSLTPESVVRASVLRELANNGLGVRSLTIEQGWFSTLSTVTVTVNALTSQSQADVMAIVTGAFRNIAAVFPDMIWNVGTFQITDWPSGQAQDGGGYGGNVGGGLGGGYDGGLIDIGGFDGGTVYGGSTPGTTPTGTNQTPQTGNSFEQQMNSVTTWLKAHQTEAMLGGLILVVLLLKR